MDKSNQNAEPLFLRALLAQWEQEAKAVPHHAPLMDQAGAAAADLALQLAGERGGTIVIVVGDGNNAGDGLEAGHCLLAQGFTCRVMQIGAAGRWHGDAARAYARFAAQGGVVEPYADRFADAALIIDAIFGTGLSRAPEGHARDAIDAINRARARGTRVLALDIASGLMSDSGHAPGACIDASTTLTYLGGKPGLYTGGGPDHSGDIVLAPLQPAINLATPGLLSHPRCFADLLLGRSRDTNKGSFGTIGVIGGAHGTVGAALLAARAALYLGAGKVFVETLGDTSLVVDPLHPELMIRQRIDLEHVDVVVIGPGLSESEAAQAVLLQVANSALPAVIDADALNLCAKHDTLRDAVAARAAASILTPHPLEAARLLGIDVKAVQRDRIGAAQQIAKRFAAVVILKGAGSIVAAPDGRWAVNPTGNPGLASGGTGDVLSGVLGGLLGQRKDAYSTALAGCYLHGAGADDLVAAGVGPIGLNASELIPAIRASLNRHSQKR